MPNDNQDVRETLDALSDECMIRIINNQVIKVMDILDNLQNPYPENIFIEPTDEQYKLAEEKLKEVGLTIGKFCGTFGRRVHNNLKSELIEKLTEILNPSGIQNGL